MKGMNRHSRYTRYTCCKSLKRSSSHNSRKTSPFAVPMLACAVALGSGSVLAQTSTPIEEIVVSADFRRAAVDDIAASVSVLDAQLIAEKNALHLEDILRNAPNVNLASGASRARFIQIRGIGERAQYGEPLNPSVGLLIDGVDFSGIGGAAMLYDVEQVEVLMGPQGTRYGSNALAGLINVQSKAASATPGFGLQLQGENYGGSGIAGYATGPLSDALLGRLSVQTLESDGFIHNRTLNRSTNERREDLVRGKLQWQLSDDISSEFTLARIDIDNGYDAFSLDNNRETLSDEPGFDRQRSTLASFRLDSASFDQFDLQLLVGLADSDIGYGYDEDWTVAGFHPDEYSSTDHYLRDHNTRSAEVRLLSNENGGLFGGRTTWVTGLYTLDQQVDMERRYTYLPGPFTSSYDIARTALYGDTSTSLGGNFSVDAGLRVENIIASYRDSDLLAAYPDDVLAGGRLALNYHTAGNALLYTSVSRGYKTGGFNTDGSLDADLRPFDAELLWNYEAGFKGTLFHDQLQTQLALFYMDRDDVQINSSTTRMRNDGSAEFIQYTGNAAAGFNRGLELSAQWVSNQRVTVYGSLGLLDSEYEDFVNSAGDNLDGRQQAHAPDYQYTVGSNFYLLPDVTLNLNVQGADGFYFSDSHAERSDAYALLNAALSWQWQQATVRLWGRNLLEDDYYVRGFYFGNDPRDGYTAKGYTQLGEPQRYGLSLNLEF
jgi:iron complex outermembrane receptor protein